MSKLIRFTAVNLCLLYITSCASNSRTPPDWVSDPYKKYNRQAFVAVVGSGNTRQSAEKNALANLVSFFGQSVQVDERVYTSYRESVRNGVSVGWTENTSVNNEIIISSGMDTLIGAEIGEVWFDKNNTYYAAAVMNKTKTIQIYSNLISSNQIIINKLIDIPASSKNTLEGFTRYSSAANIAEINQSFANILSVIGSGYTQDLKRSDDYKLEARNISQAIPVSVRVRNDRQNRIQSAFTKTLTDIGFRTGGINPRYIIEISITTLPVEMLNNPNKFVRMELNADLIDTANRMVLLPYSFNEREGHTTLENAENRIFLTAERRISQEYKDLLKNYLSQIISVR